MYTISNLSTICRNNIIMKQKSHLQNQSPQQSGDRHQGVATALHSQSPTISSLTFLIPGGTSLYADFSCRKKTTGRKLQHVMTEMFLCEAFVEKNDVTITLELSSLAPRLQLDLDLMESRILPQFGPWMIYSPFKETELTSEALTQQI